MEVEEEGSTQYNHMYDDQEWLVWGVKNNAVTSIRYDNQHDSVAVSSVIIIVDSGRTGNLFYM